MDFIAEIGSNWQRPYEADAYVAACRSIREAAAQGATAVKFQLFRADSLYSKNRAPKQWKRARGYELPLDWLPGLADVAHECGVEFWCSVFAPGLVREAAQYLDAIKVASGDITYTELLITARAASFRRAIPLAVSTGAATEAEVWDVVRLWWKMWRHPAPDFYLFQCVSQYPAGAEQMNLSVVQSEPFQEAHRVGLSDHTLTSTAAMLAVALGYSLFEKHVMLPGTPEDSPDYGHSLTPEQFGYYVKDIQRAESIVGSGRKEPTEAEAGERQWARRGADGLRPVE